MSVDTGQNDIHVACECHDIGLGGVKDSDRRCPRLRWAARLSVTEEYSKLTEKKLGDHSEAEEDIVPRNVNSDEEDIISSLDITILINTEYDKYI